jgi:hypothetical protein
MIHSKKYLTMSPGSQRRPQGAVLLILQLSSLRPRGAGYPRSGWQRLERSVSDSMASREAAAILKACWLWYNQDRSS